MFNLLVDMHWEWDAKIVEFFNKMTEISFIEKLFKGISYLGTEYAVIALFGICYWIFDKKLAKDVGISAFIAMLFNGLFKGIVNRPRPFQQFDNIECRDSSILYEDGRTFSANDVKGTHIIEGKRMSTSTSFPSGHSQNSSALYNGFAIELNKKWLLILANVLALLVMISRMALGVHFFTDVVTGYAIGLGVVLLFNFLRKKFKNENNLTHSIILVFTIITFLSPLWAKESKDMFDMLGVIYGIILGMAFEEKKVNFKPTKVWWKAVLRFVFGIGFVLGLKSGLKLLYVNDLWSVSQGTYLYNVLDMIRYGLFTFFACGLYPIIIKELKFLND